MDPTHLHGPERDGADGFATFAEPVVAERIVYPADDAGGVEYEPEVTVGRKSLDDDELGAGVEGRGDDGMLGEEIVGV